MNASRSLRSNRVKRWREPALANAEFLRATYRNHGFRIGGGFSQAGIIAAGALYALQNNRTRLNEYHEHARRFAQGIASLPGISIDVSSVQTNIVRFVIDSSPLAISSKGYTRRAFMCRLHGTTACVRSLT
jgi:threonine aldolase